MKLKSALVATFCIVVTVVSATQHIFGARVEGDQLLISDTLHNQENGTIRFKYAVDRLVSCIDVSTNINAHTSFDLTPDNIVHGEVFEIEAPDAEVQIQIFGIHESDAPPNFQPVLETGTKVDKRIEELADEEYFDYDDNTILLGERQPDDELVYETYEYSMDSKNPKNHSVVFYYIDSYYLTHAEFVTLSNSTASATFSHVTDHSIKATIYEEDVNFLDVRIRLYGYRPDKKPADYVPMLSAMRHGEPHDFIPLERKCPPLALIKEENLATKTTFDASWVTLSFITSALYLVA